MEPHAHDDAHASPPPGDQGGSVRLPWDPIGALVSGRGLTYEECLAYTEDGAPRTER